MEYFLLYLLTSVGKVAALLKMSGVIFILSAVVIVIGVIFSILASLEHGETIEWGLGKFKSAFGKPLKAILISTAVLYSLGSILPTERDMALIIGGGVAYQAATSDKGKEIGGKAVELLMQKVDELLEQPKEYKGDNTKERLYEFAQRD